MIGNKKKEFLCSYHLLLLPVSVSAFLYTPTLLSGKSEQLLITNHSVTLMTEFHAPNH